MNTLSKAHDLVLAAVIATIIVIMALMPFLGYIPLGFMNATATHIPAIIEAIILGPKYRAFLGLTFGLTSSQRNTFMPNPASFVFSPFITMEQFHGDPGNLVTCLAPRILIGVVAYYVHRLFMRMPRNRRNKQGAALFVAGAVGSLIDTPLVMNLIYLLFGDQYVSTASWTAKWVCGVVLGIIGMQGASEALVAGITVTAVIRTLLKITPGSRGQARNRIYTKHSNAAL